MAKETVYTHYFGNIKGSTHMNCCMKARLGSSAFNTLISQSQAIYNLLSQCTAIFGRIYFDDIVCAKLLGFI